MKVTKLLVFIVCIFLLTELFIDDVEARNKGKNKRKRRKNKHKGCKGKPKTGRCARKKSKITTTTVATTTTTGSSLMTPVKVQREQHPNMRNRQQSLNQRSYFSFMAELLGDTIPETGSFEIPGLESSFEWDFSEIDSGDVFNIVEEEDSTFISTSGDIWTTGDENDQELNQDLFIREWRGKGSYTGDVRLHCIEKECTKGVVQIYNKEERSWGNVCSGGWGRRESQLVCKYLQFIGHAKTRRMKIKHAPRDVKEKEDRWDNVRCNGREKSFAECQGRAMEMGQSCRSGYYAVVQCGAGRVIDNSEVQCTRKDSVRCANGQKCIDQNYICDGMADCPWGTDEEQCGITPETCGANQFNCGDSNGGCILDSFRCDGDMDCTDGIDENNCKNYLSAFKRMKNYKLRATNYESGWRHVTSHVCARKCVEEKTFKCNGFNYNKEKKECDLTSSSRNSLGVSPAIEKDKSFDYFELRRTDCKSFVCGNGVCLDNSLVCNGENDCEDGDDEKNCEEHNLYPEIVFGRLSGDANHLLAHIEGRLEVSVNEDFSSNFGLVCDVGWTLNEANVACRQLGYKRGAYKALRGQHFKRINLPYKLSGVKCKGNERSLAECQHNGWNNASNCMMDHEAGVICLLDEIITPLTTLTMPKPMTTTNTPTTTGQPLRTTTRKPSKNFQCGIKPVLTTSRIVGGNQVAPNSWPWQIGLWVYGQFNCGGTIISPCWIVTAAHCLDEDIAANYYHVVLGDHRTRAIDGTEQEFRVKKFIIHPNYNKDTSDTDIALLQIRESSDGKCAIFSDNVKPICLPTGVNQFKEGHSCFITGWGKTSTTSAIAYQNALRQALVPLISDSTCRTKTRYRSSMITDNMMCAGYLQGGVDTCQGDSGGPLVCPNRNVYTLVGVTSFGNGCALPNYPGVYVKVANFIDWIEKHVDDL